MISRGGSNSMSLVFKKCLCQNESIKNLIPGSATGSQVVQTVTIGGPRGAHPAVPQGTRFFPFDIQILRNVAASGVHAPLWEILDPPLVTKCSSRQRPMYVGHSGKRLDMEDHFYLARWVDTRTMSKCWWMYSKTRDNLHTRTYRMYMYMYI